MLPKISRIEVRAFDGSLINDEALDRILATITVLPSHCEEGREGGRVALRSFLAPVTTDWEQQRRVARQLSTAHRKLDERLREHGYDAAANAIAGIFSENVADWSKWMVAGSYLMQAYLAMTGKQPTITRNGPAVRFLCQVMQERKSGSYTEEAAIKAMRAYKPPRVDRK